MMQVFDNLGYRALRFYSPQGSVAPFSNNKDVPQGEAKLENAFGSQFWTQIQGKSVVDFGCGLGHEVVAIAKRGARFVTGVVFDH